MAAKAKKFAEEYGVEASDSDSDGFDASEMLFLSKKKAKKDLGPDSPSSPSVITPVKARFSLESLLSEETTRKQIAQDLAQEMAAASGSSSGDDNDDDGGEAKKKRGDLEFGALFDSAKGAELMAMVAAINHKTTDDLDLQSFFHRWTVEGKSNFHARAPLRLPEVLTRSVGSHLASSPQFAKMVLCGDWIPSLFPALCPDEVAEWLFECICFAADDAVSAAAWDTWTFYFGRGGLWDPADASFSWFRAGSQQVALTWVPDWQRVVATLAAFGAPTEPYLQKEEDGASGSSGTPMPVRDSPPRVDRALRPVLPSADLVGLLSSRPASSSLFSFGPLFPGLVVGSSGGRRSSLLLCSGRVAGADLSGRSHRSSFGDESQARAHSVHRRRSLRSPRRRHPSLSAPRLLAWPLATIFSPSSLP